MRDREPPRLHEVQRVKVRLFAALSSAPVVFSTTMRERHAHPASLKKTHVTLDMGLYDASLLRDEVALEVAIGDLESNLAKAQNADCIVEQLASVPHLLEFALSSEYLVSHRFMCPFSILDAQASTIAPLEK